jgi:hypothetical protein
VVGSGISCSVELHHGEPAATIARRAAELHAELLVVGRRRRGALDRLLFGSVSDEIMRRAPCPVVVVPATRAGRGDPQHGARALAGPAKGDWKYLRIGGNEFPFDAVARMSSRRPKMTAYVAMNQTRASAPAPGEMIRAIPNRSDTTPLTTIHHSL